MEAGWQKALHEELESTHFNTLILFLQKEKETGKTIYPNEENIFRAFQLTPFESIKVVILGQDPYHGLGQAHGLAFSVADGSKQPPSLKNIFKELQADLGISPPTSGNLSFWAEQGVLLLNTILTVEADKAASHQKKGWEQFTDGVIKALSEKHTGLVFLLWGNHAKEKAKCIDTTKHHLLLAPHPSPLSAYQGFLGCSHFSKTNTILRSQDKASIHWGNLKTLTQ
jgi:uracil-DNA glycosylase